MEKKHVGVKESTYINFSVENNGKDPKFKVSNHVRISKYKNISFQKVTLKIRQKPVFLSKKVKNTASWKLVMEDLHDAEITEKELQRKESNKD